VALQSKRQMPRVHLRSLELPPALTGWAVVDEIGRPRYWATIWEGHLLAGKKGSRARHLANIERFYRAVESYSGEDCLDEILAVRDFDKIEACLTSYLSSLQNEAARRRVDLSDPWKSALKFTRSVLEHLGRSEAAQLSQVEARLTRLKALYSQVSANKKKEALPIRALPSIVVNELMEIFDPESERNPFVSMPNRVRNYLLFVMYFALGLRRGEALILPANAFKSDVDLVTGNRVRWLNVTSMEQEDRRYYPPSLKTSYSERQIPVSLELLNIVNFYVNNFRRRSGFSQLFISQKLAPLASQTVNEIFVEATLALSADAKRALEGRGWMQIRAGMRARSDVGRKKWVSPHDLRHTAAVTRLKRYIDSGDGTDEALNKLRVYFGWSPASKMPFHYARAYWLTDAAELEELRFDKYIAALRRIDTSLEERLP
jgi:integrase